MIATQEHPILFNGEMVRAILEGRKTQTRRPIKMPFEGLEFVGWHPEDASIARFMREDAVGTTHWSSRCPYGIPGDRLWVRETWAPVDDLMYGYELDSPEWVMFRADGVLWNTMSKVQGDRGDLVDPDRWSPSIHMPRWASRIDLEVRRVEVQRIQDISQRDALYEGCPGGRDELNRRTVEMLSDSSTGAAMRVWFRDQWDAIYADRGLGWDVNPWVWGIYFRRVP